MTQTFVVCRQCAARPERMWFMRPPWRGGVRGRARALRFLWSDRPADAWRVHPTLARALAEYWNACRAEAWGPRVAQLNPAEARPAVPAERAA